MTDLSLTILHELSAIKITVLLMIVLASPAFSGEKPLTDEEIVRRVIAGESHDGIIALIKAGATDFDLSDEMVEEMKIAGVPEPILQAMRERHLELYPPPEPETDEYEVPSPPALIIHLKVKKPPVLPKETSGPIGGTGRTIQFDEESRQISGAALFVACTSPTHVPDHWRGSRPWDGTSSSLHGTGCCCSSRRSKPATISR